MESGVISDQLSEIINGRKVVAALFTTYTFEPDFFELEIIPLLLKQNTPYSINENVKRFMVRDKLRESGMPIDVYYDLPMFRQSGESSPQMEYHCSGINLGNRAFHGKVNMLLVYDDALKEKVLLIGAGSNNLTQAGWWDNIECQHWEEVRSGYAQRKFVNLLKEDIDFLIEHHAGFSGENGSAISDIHSFLSSCKGSNSAEKVFYFGLSYIQNRGSFPAFLTQDNSPLTNYNNWKLEIISPFFVDNAKSNIHTRLLESGVKEIKLLLPVDSENNALCQDIYFHHINDSSNISWAAWEKGLLASLGGQFNAVPFRRIHAKVYHFYNDMDSWVFVGSVNFTHMAMHKNVEAGFLVRQKSISPMLEAIDDDKDISFAKLDEVAPGNSQESEEEAVIPEIHLSFDWLEKKLLGYAKSAMDKVSIEILNAEGKSAIKQWVLTDEPSEYELSTKELEAVLKNGSLVMVHSPGNLFQDHRVLLQQFHWSHKPQFDGLNLSAEQILAIYAGMSPERRQTMLVDVKIRALMSSEMAGELTASDNDQLIDQFFCEYAEIFNAFHKLKAMLSDELVKERSEQLDYYLTGSGIDSLPSLIEGVFDTGDEQTTSSVTAYLLLLSAIEVYQDERFRDRPNVSAKVEDFEKKKEEIKNVISLEKGTGRNEFFTWFETQFFRAYKPIERVEQA